MIERYVIEQVLERTDIVQLISKYVDLAKKGSRYFACCPFHQEKTPSFAVFPNSGKYKCFGCLKGGNAISFLMEHKRMTYPEAIKSLAKDCGVEIHEKELNPQEEQKYQIRQAMWAANSRLQKLYVRELGKCQEAKAYAYGRWGEEFCKQMEIGYCPKGAKLVAEASISDTLAEQMHLRNRAGYDFFFDRIVIPIKDWQGRIIGFTARAMNFIKGKNAKYLNSEASEIYDKSKSVFGIDMAWREASKKRTLYLVEGAPDCLKMQSLGILNTVAPLGTAWTADHFRIMRRVADKLCFIPDADPPNEDEEFGPGIKAVMKSGEDAVKEGFMVSVKQIPVGSEKQDPDSYFKKKQDFQALEEQDYILWLADLLFYDNMTSAQQGEVIGRIAMLMTYIEDESTISIYIANLAKIVGKVSLWKKALETSRNKRAEEEATAKAEKGSDLYKEFGFSVEKDKRGNEIYYYSISEQGGIYVWSNFVMRPLFHIKDTTNAKRLYEIRNVFGKQELVELKQEDLVSLQKFMVRIESLGNFVWKATQRELNKLKQYLYEKTETAMEIKQLGWQRQGFFAFGNGIFDGEKFIKVDEQGIVRMKDENYYLPANSNIYRNETKLFQFERKFVHLGLSTITLREYTDQIFRVFGDNGRVGFIFLLATLFRDVAKSANGSFPILNFFGQISSGKSALGHSLMAFFIIDNRPANMLNSTIPALSESVAQVANALVQFDEFKNDLDTSKIEFLKGLWDGTGRTRMNMDMDKKKETTSVDSGIILTGQQMPTADIAVFSRLIFLTFDRSEFTVEEKDEYKKLEMMRAQGMTHLTMQLLKNRRKVEEEYKNYYDLTSKDVNKMVRDLPIEERIIGNWVIPLAMLRCLENDIDTSLTYKQMLEICVNGIKYQGAQCKQNNELAAFWNMVTFLVSEGELIEGGDYRIEYQHRLKTDKVDSNWLVARRVLYIQKTRIFMLYKKYAKNIGENVLPEGSLKHYLENSNEYFGEKVIKYKVYHRGIVVMKKVDGMQMEAATTQRSYCFNYDQLSETFKINLTKAAYDDMNLEDIDDDNDIQRKLNFEKANT